MVRLDRCPRRRKSNSREDHSCLSMSLRICSSRLTPALRALVQTLSHVAPRARAPQMTQRLRALILWQRFVLPDEMPVSQTRQRVFHACASNCCEPILCLCFCAGRPHFLYSLLSCLPSRVCFLLYALLFLLLRFSLRLPTSFHFLLLSLFCGFLALKIPCNGHLALLRVFPRFPPGARCLNFHLLLTAQNFLLLGLQVLELLLLFLKLLPLFIQRAVESIVFFFASSCAALKLLFSMIFCC